MLRFPERERISSSCRDIFSLMLENATPKQWAEWLPPPLEHAAARGDLDMVRKLLNAGANGKPGTRGCRGRTLLDAAAEGGNEKVIGALLAAGARSDVNVRSGSNRRSPLHRAALLGHEAAATALLLAGADVYLLDSEKRQPLHLAVNGGHHQVVCNLLLAESTPNAKDKRGNAPLHVAATLGHDRIVSALLLKGADKNALDHFGRAPLHVAAENGHHIVVEALLAAGADVSIRHGNNELSVLDSAASHGRHDVLKTLFEHGVNLNATDSTGYTSLHMASDSNQARSIDYLVSAGAQVDALDQHHWTPLHCAVRYSICDEAIITLLKHGANVQAKDTAGESPLHVACSYLAEVAVDLLLRHGADETAVNDDGRTPAEVIGTYAEDSNNREREATSVRRCIEKAPEDRAWRRRGMLVMCRRFANTRLQGQDTSSRADDDRQKLSKTSNWEAVVHRDHMGDERTLSHGTQSTEASAKTGARSTLLRRAVHLHEEGIFRTIIEFL